MLQNSDPYCIAMIQWTCQKNFESECQSFQIFQTFESNILNMTEFSFDLKIEFNSGSLAVRQ